MSADSNHYHHLFESLEERVLFDGVPDATFVLPQADAVEPAPAQVQSIHQADVAGPVELILIDAGVEDSDQLLAEVLENRSDSAFEIRMINADSDGVTQISAILSEADGKYDAIHIISHGDEGEVNLGNSALTADNLNRYTDQLAGWADALTEDADLLFYGCDLAGNAEGEQFIESISAITGADVAASDDLTGAEDKGGDWELELNVGAIEAASLVAENWDGILADKDGDGVDDVDDLDDDNDGILDTNEGFVPKTTVPINSANLNTPGFPTDTDVSTGNTAQLTGLFGGLLDFEAELVGPTAPPFTSSPDLNVTFFNEQQFAFGFGLQNTTNQPITNWSVQIAGANYNLNQSQFTNSSAFTLTTTTNPNGTFTHTFVGNSTIPAFGGIPGGNIAINGVNFGFPLSSNGLVTGFGGGTSSAGGGPTFAGGVQVQNDPALGGDFIFTQPEGLGNFPTEFAEYSFDFNTPVHDLSFDTGAVSYTHLTLPTKA